MIKLEFNKQEQFSTTKKVFYSSLDPIPFAITIGDHKSFPPTIYCRNLKGENFVEFRFNKETGVLFEINLIAVQQNTVNNVPELSGLKKDPSGYFNCSIIEEGSVLENSLDMSILRTEKQVCIVLNNSQIDNLNFYQVASGVYIGVDDGMALSSILLDNLLPENIFDIFGF